MESSECEREGLNTRIEKLDLELAIGDRPLLPDQLIQTLLAHRALALRVDVDAVRATRRLAVDAHAEPHGRPFRHRSQNHVEIAGVEGVKEAVRAGMGIGFVSAMSMRHEDDVLCRFSLSPEPLTRRFSILMPRASVPSRVAERFLELCLADAG